MKKLTVFLTILMGVSCFCGQVLFIREFLIVFYGNELTIGLILANWLLLEAAGSFIFGLSSEKIRNPVKAYAVNQIITAFLFPLSIIAARIIKVFFHIPAGQGAGIPLIFLASFLVMAPLGFLLGGQFPLACRLYREARGETLTAAAGKNYFLEAIGFGTGGILITYLCLPFFYSLSISFAVGWINLICAVTLLLGEKKSIWRTAIAFLSAAGLLICVFCIPFLETASRKYQWKEFNLIDYQNTPYGNIAVTRQENQTVFFYDGLPFMSVPVPDIAFTQDIINFTLAASSGTEKVAVIGAGLGGIIENILRFPVSRVEYAELDPMIISLAKKHSTVLTEAELTSPKLNISYVDGRLFLKQSAGGFDVIIINLSAPYTIFLNRYYTLEFFQLAKERLRDKGVLCFSLPGSLSYLSKEQAEVNKCILQTAQAVFPRLEIIPGDYNIFLASTSADFKISPESIKTLLEKYNVKSALFNEAYIRDRLSPDHKNWFEKSIKGINVPINRDLRPIAVFYSLGLRNSLFSPKLQRLFRELPELRKKATPRQGIIVVIWILVIGSAIALLKKPGTPSADPVQGLIPLITTLNGFAGVSLNLIFLLGLQTFYGYVYLHAGLLISSFMLGLTAGGVIMTSKLRVLARTEASLLKIYSAFVIFCLLTLPFLFMLQKMSAQKVPAIIVLCAFSAVPAIAGFFVGAQFPLANRIFLGKEPKAGSKRNILYAFDMLGAFLGTLLMSSLVIPLFGMPAAIMLIVFLKLEALYLLATSFFFSGRKYL